jgi:hypothetical protein
MPRDKIVHVMTLTFFLRSPVVEVSPAMMRSTTPTLCWSCILFILLVILIIFFIIIVIIDFAISSLVIKFGVVDWNYLFILYEQSVYS